MSDLDVLRELVGQLRPPEYADLVAVSRKRRRRSALGAAAGAAVVVLGVGIAGAALSGGQRALAPAQDPSPSQVDEWTPERVRAKGSPVGDVFDYRLGPAPSGLDAELYCIGVRDCDGFPPDVEGRTGHWALEMTQGGRSALFEVQGAPWARYFGEESILVQDGSDQAVRFRLLKADGTAMPLRVVGDLAPAVPGPDVMLIQALDRARDYQVGPEGPGINPYLVDDRAGTLQLLDVPAEIKEWGPNVTEFLWGTTGCRVIWQQPDGSFDQHDVDCRHPEITDLPGDYWDGLDDWAEPGRMVLLGHNFDGVPLVVHASLDYGATWERIEVEDRNWDGTIAQSTDAIADALRPLG